MDPQLAWRGPLSGIWLSLTNYRGLCSLTSIPIYLAAVHYLIDLAALNDGKHTINLPGLWC